MHDSLAQRCWRLEYVALAGAALVLLLTHENAALAAETPSFRNDVMAVLSKAGCNAGACHGNKNG